MTLAAGTRLGPYEVMSPLGSGGMGEVYKATDTRLNRIVAIKILNAQLAADPDFRARFHREANAISQLDHPNICTLFDVGEQDGTAFLVMQYLEGEALAERLERGKLPVDHALAISIQIADALTTAHRAGVVHRDLKPGNIFLTKTGVDSAGSPQAKLLDFGLAKSTDPAVTNASLSMLPTTPPNMTAQGTILGTFQYMAPEQLEGQEADVRTDIFAFGVVVYEMLTGTKAFEGRSQASLIAAILRHEPVSIVSVQPLAPAVLDRVVRKCLAKDPDARWQSASDLRDELKWISEAPLQTGTPESTMGGRRSAVRLPLILSGLVGCALAVALGAWRLTSAPAASPVVRLLLTVTPADQLLGINSDERRFSPHRPSRTAMAWSPDGQRLVFSASRGERQQLFMRTLERLDAVPMAGTEDSESPFFSSDGQWVAFWKGGELKKVPSSIGPAVTICPSPPISGASWGSNNLVVFSRGGGGLWQVSGNGGTPQPLTTLNTQNGERSHVLPHLLPDAKAVLFTIRKRGAIGRWDEGQIAVRSLVSGEQRILVEGGTDARYVASGHLIYARKGTLMAAPFDVARLALTGGPVGIVDNVMQALNAPSGGIETGAAQFSVSGSGTLIYVPGGVFPGAERSIVWVDRAGRIQPLPVQPRSYLAPRLSPDGQRPALMTQGEDGEVWIYDLHRETLTRFTTGGGSTPIWTPDGKRLTFHARSLFWKAADGTGVPERLTTSEGVQQPESWSPDGKTLAYFQGETLAGGDVWMLSVGDPDRKAWPFVQTAASEQRADFSPDGRWVAYGSDESGRYEVYVQPYPGPGQRHQVSVRGGTQPVWHRNGRELFYTVPNSTPTADLNKIMVVDVTTTPTFTAGIPRPLESVVRLTIPIRGYDVAADGQRFLTVRDNERPEPPPAHMIVVQNWTEELKRLVPTK